MDDTMARLQAKRLLGWPEAQALGIPRAQWYARFCKDFGVRMGRTVRVPADRVLAVLEGREPERAA
jgi:hypothetical protein